MSEKRTEAGFIIDERDAVDPESAALAVKARKLAEERNIDFAEAAGIVVDEQSAELHESARQQRLTDFEAESVRRSKIDGDKLNARAAVVSKEKGIDFSEAIVDVYHNEYDSICKTPVSESAPAVSAATLQRLYGLSADKAARLSKDPELTAEFIEKIEKMPGKSGTVSLSRSPRS